MVLIGLIGYKHSGKDTMADYLVQKYGFKKHAFADPVKQACRIMFQLEKEQLDDPQLKEVLDERWGMTPRQMMQKFGTDMVRCMLGDDFWVKNMDMKIQKETNNNIVISDVRFRNEAEWVRQNNGVLIRIVDGKTQHTDTHPSETEQLSIQEDIHIINEKKGIPLFHQEADTLLQTMFV